ncbi:MAG: DbpA RNA binding domain-containing protein, partial [Pseudomonadales bacterium]
LFLPPEKKVDRSKPREAKKPRQQGRESHEKNKSQHEARPIRSRKAKQIVDDDGEVVAMEAYRIAVGHDHEVQPGDIVGAIANEADIKSKYIGRVQIFDSYSTIELPAGMPRDLFKHLQNVRVKQQKLAIAPAHARSTGSQPPKKKTKPARPEARKRSANKPGKKLGEKAAT